LVRLFIGLNPGGIPRFDQASVNTRVLLVAVALSIATGLAAGLLPALSASSPRITSGSRITGTHRSHLALIVFEIALSVVLLSGAGLLIRSYLNLQAVDPGFSPTVLTFQLSLDEHYPTQESHDAFHKTLLAGLQDTAGFTLVGASTGLPLNQDLGFGEVDVEGFGPTPELVEIFGATSDYRRAIGTPLLRGRDFTLGDLKSKNILVNKKFVASYLRGREPIGGRLSIGPHSSKTFSNKPDRYTIVGVLADTHYEDLAVEPKPALFQPTQSGDSYAIRSSLTPEQAASQIRSLVHSLDPALSVDVETMRRRISDTNARRTFQTSILSGFAFVAVALALVGLYGLMAYTVKQRTPEIGIRLAVGSPRSRILTLILAQGLRLTAAGLLIGLAAAFALTRLIHSWLFQIQPTDPLTFTLVPLAILGVSCAACLIPAWTATRIDPIQTLRQE
jgi:predicted permease